MNVRRVIKKLRKADVITVDAIFNAVLARKIELYPDWEIVYLALEREDQDKRRKMLQAMLNAIATEEVQ